MNESCPWAGLMLAKSEAELGIVIRQDMLTVLPNNPKHSGFMQ